MAQQVILRVLDPLSADIEGLYATIVMTSPNDSAVYVRGETTSESRSGGLVFDLSAERLSLKYDYNVVVTVARQFIDPDTYLDSTIRKTVKLTDTGDGITWSDLNLGTWSVPVVEATVSIATKKVEVQTAYDAYITARDAYEAVIANADTIELEQLETYEPASPTYIATRLLEFQTGTLIPAIRYATDAQLETHLDYLNRINKFVNLYVGLYPTISINDGEGIPYNV